MSKFATSDELAEALGISRSAVIMWIKQGKVKAIRVGKLWRIPLDEYDRVVKNGTDPQKITLAPESTLVLE